MVTLSWQAYTTSPRLWPLTWPINLVVTWPVCNRYFTLWSPYDLSVRPNFCQTGVSRKSYIRWWYLYCLKTHATREAGTMVSSPMLWCVQATLVDGEMHALWVVTWNEMCLFESHFVDRIFCATFVAEKHSKFRYVLNPRHIVVCIWSFMYYQIWTNQNYMYLCFPVLNAFLHSFQTCLIPALAAISRETLEAPWCVGILPLGPGNWPGWPAGGRTAGQPINQESTQRSPDSLTGSNIICHLRIRVSGSSKGARVDFDHNLHSSQAVIEDKLNV